MLQHLPQKDQQMLEHGGARVVDCLETGVELVVYILFRPIHGRPTHLPCWLLSRDRIRLALFSAAHRVVRKIALLHAQCVARGLGKVCILRDA